MNEYKKAEPVIEKYGNKYDYHPVYHPAPKAPRFVLRDGIWEQTQPGTENEATVMCAGDLMCEPVMSEDYYFDGRYFFHPCFKYVKKAFAEGDLCLANLETLVSDRYPFAHEKHIIKSGDHMRYLCNAPTDYLDALRYAGFDGFAMANNHACDLGYDGIVDTVENVRKWGFPATGAFTDKKEHRILHFRINGIRLAMISYTGFINEHLHTDLLTEEGTEVMVNMYDKAKAEREIAQARAEGADIVLVYMHFRGKQYSNDLMPEVRQTAVEIAECGADILMGSHMHAVQKYEALYTSDGRRVPVIYSLSNFICSDEAPTTRDSVIYCVKLRKKNGKTEIAGESYIPCHNMESADRSGYVVFPTRPRYREFPDFGDDAEVLQEAEARIASVIGDEIRIRE